MPCDRCNDAGYIIKTDILNARRSKEVCPLCKGIKEKPTLDPNGVRHHALNVIVYPFQKFVNNNPVSTLELWITPILENRLPATIKDSPISKPRQRIYAQIRDMNTKKKYRKQGIMTNLLMIAVQDPKIEWFETNWMDSSEEGRRLLLEFGFEREGNKLVYRQPQGAGKN